MRLSFSYAKQDANTSDISINKLRSRTIQALQVYIRCTGRLLVKEEMYFNV